VGLRPVRKGFTVLRDDQYAKTLAGRLIGPVDLLRDLLTRAGLRPYIVRLVWTRWSEGQRGYGTEEVAREEVLLPTPKIAPLDSLDAQQFSIGAEEIGDIMLEQISARYTEDFILGRNAVGDPIAEDEEFYYEVEFPQENGVFPGIRRRFVLSGAPNRSAGQFQWKVMLRKAVENRQRDGTPED